MSDLDSNLARALDRWRVSGSRPDWSDVLSRVRGPSMVRRRRAGLAFASAAAVVLAAPALAVLVGLWDASRPLVTATLTGVPGVSGRLEAGSPGAIFVARTGRIVPFGRLRRPGEPERPLTLRWRLAVEGLDGGIASARLLRGPGARHGSPLVTLCRPCTATDEGRVQLSRIGLTAALNGATVVVETDRGLLRGIVRRNPSD